MILTDNSKRCGLFLFFDKHGIVDDYVIYMLKDMKKSLDYLLVISNGFVKRESIDKMNSVADEIICRANIGFDVGGYREGLFYLGWKKLQEYDEIVFFNYTMMGPIFSFTEMFDKMSQKDVDFWGITKFHKVDGVPFGEISYGYLPEHIQSHFIAVRKDMFISYQYRDFMFNRLNPKNYIEAICGYEAIFTKYFSDLGFKWDVYADSTELEGTVLYPAVNKAKWMLQAKRCPIIKRRSFFTNYYDFLSDNTGEVSVELFEYLRKSKLYDLNMIWDNILRLENMTAIHRNLHLNYFLENKNNDYAWNKKLAIMLLVEDSFPVLLFEEEIRKIPVNKADIFVLGCKHQIDSIKNIITDGACCFECAETEYVSLLKKSADVIKEHKYDYVCVISLSDVEKNKKAIEQISYIKNAWKAVAENENVIGNAIKSMEDNPRMGMLIPPFAVHGEYFRKNEEPWCGRFKEIKSYIADLEPSVNVSEGERPIASLSGNFWIRYDLLLDLIDRLPNKDKDLAMMLLPIYIQWKLEYVGVSLERDCARGDLTNRFYMMRENNKAIFKNVYAGKHMQVRAALNDYVNRKLIERKS